jgi:hypothetical protein
MEDNRGKILEFIKQKGPVLPIDVAKHIGSNILIASAHLSELSSNKKVKISNVKFGGGSPLYYLPGQESQLQKFSDNLNEKDKRAYDLLSQKKILQDSKVDPLTRVALRAIKDYAVPLQVNFKGNSEIFWRWYLLTNQEAENLIKPLFQEDSKPKLTIPKPQSSQPPKHEVKQETPQDHEPKKPVETTKKQQPIEKIEPKRTKEEVQKTIQPKKPTKELGNDFTGQISKYFVKNNITVLSKEIIRKSEIDFIIQVPSAVGNLEYYCKTKNKKKINDADLASAFVQGQLRKLPVLFLTNGDLTKKSKEMLQKDFKGMGVKAI